MTEEFNIELEASMNAVQLYLNQISQIPLLTEAEEYRLATLAREGDFIARNKLIESNLRLVVSVAKHYHTNALTFMDLIQEGNVGLVHAADKFDPDKGNRFSTYAVWWIRQHISRALGEATGAIRLPANIVEHANKLAKVISEYNNQYGVEPSNSELAELTEWDSNYIARLREASGETVSLDMSINDDDNALTLGDTIPDDKYNPVEEIFKEEKNKAINNILDTLTPREKIVLRDHLGLLGAKPKTLSEIGDAMNITRERTRQIEIKALRKLRHPGRANILKQVMN